MELKAMPEATALTVGMARLETMEILVQLAHRDCRATMARLVRPEALAQQGSRDLQVQLEQMVRLVQLVQQDTQVQLELPARKELLDRLVPVGPLELLGIQVRPVQMATREPLVQQVLEPLALMVPKDCLDPTVPVVLLDMWVLWDRQEEPVALALLVVQGMQA